jgi:O-antigen ligase
MLFIANLIVYFIIATIPLIFAAVQPWVWSVYSVLIIAAFLFILWQGGSKRVWVPNKIFIFTVAVFFIVTLSQYLPLPQYILSILSPFRHEVLLTSNEMISNPLSWDTLSYSPLLSFSWWTFLLCAFLFFIVLKNFCDSRKSLKLLVGLMVGLAIVEAIYGLIQALIPSLGVLWVDYIRSYMGDARGTFINRNHFAGFIEMVWPLALGFTLALGYRGKEIDLRKLLASDQFNKQILLVLGMVVMLLALLLSRSRGGITGAFIGIFTFILLTRSAHKRLPLGFWLMGGAMVGLILLYGIKIGFDPIIERFLLIGEGDSRLSIWQDSLMMFTDHPLGIGLGNFSNIFPIYNVSNVSETRYLYAHNDYLQLLVEAGIPGFLALLSGFFVFLGKSVYKIRKLEPQDDPLRFFLAVGALSGLVSIAFHSFFDFNLHMPANLIYFVTLIAIVHTCAWRSAEFTGRATDKVISADYAD